MADDHFMADCGHLLEESDEYVTTEVRLGDGTLDDRFIECSGSRN
jgi:hypothetical protein